MVITCMRGRNDCIRTTPRMPLPFPVESRFDLHFTISGDATDRMAYAVLRAPFECVDAIAGDDHIQFEQISCSTTSFYELLRAFLID